MKASFIHLSGSKRGETEVLQREWIQIGSHPEISTTQLVIRCSVPPRVAIAMSVFVLAITAAFGAGMHALSAQPAWQYFSERASMTPSWYVTDNPADFASYGSRSRTR